jgi:arylsulfatase A-like enzyme
MKIHHVFALAAVALLAAPFAAAAAAPPKPNILVIFTDDHGWADLGAQGVDKDIRTPNFDRLAADGIRFTRGYVTAPQCVPSRAGLLSGQHQNRFGVDDNLKGPLPLDVLTVPERLKQAGYATGMSGKWHLDLVKEDGDRQRPSMDYLPHVHGFDEYFCGAMNRYQASHGLDGKPLANAPQEIIDQRFRVVAQTDAALGFLDRRAKQPDQPWFLYLAWFAPHVPLESPEPWFSQTPAHLPKQRRQALAMISAMDDGLGKVREKLRAMGQEENTLIFFIGDNGAPLRPGAWNGSLNLPLVGEKGMLTDGGVRVPFVAAWPGTLPKGKVYEYPVSSLDVGSTAVALAGLPHDAALDGVDLMPFLTGKNDKAPHEALFWRWRSQAAVLEFPWKLIHLGEARRYLFDVTAPDGETKNLIGQHPEIAARLEDRYKHWAATLKKPGPPDPHNGADNAFFADHVDKSPQATRRGGQAARDVNPRDQWHCRNGTAETKDGALVLSPAAGRSGVNLVHSKLNLPGPTTVKMRVRAGAAVDGGIAWRSKGQKDFPQGQSTRFQIAAGKDWQDITTTLPSREGVIHLRIMLPAAGPIEIASIDLISGSKRERADWASAP